MSQIDRNVVKKIYGQYHTEIQKQHNAAWARCENYVLSLVKKTAKTYEVNHSVEHARDIYFTEFCKGLPSDLCEKAVMQAYGKSI